MKRFPSSPQKTLPSLPPVSLSICLPTGIFGLERAGVNFITFWRELDTAMRPVERTGVIFITFGREARFHHHSGFL